MAGHVVNKGIDSAVFQHSLAEDLPLLRVEAEAHLSRADSVNNLSMCQAEEVRDLLRQDLREPQSKVGASRPKRIGP